MLLGMDPPEHTRLRGLVNRGFTPRQVARPEPRIHALSAGARGVAAGVDQQVASGMLTLLAHPEQLAALRAGPALLPSAIEETLRFVPPVVQFPRTATADVELSGQKIRAGEKVVVYYQFANRDEVVFAAPDRFDIRRSPNPHLAFGGGGAHYCLGSNLARLEIRCLFEAVLDRLHDIELAGPVPRLHSWFVDGPRRMPVRFRATA